MRTSFARACRCSQLRDDADARAQLAAVYGDCRGFGAEGGTPAARRHFIGPLNCRASSARRSRLLTARDPRRRHTRSTDRTRARQTGQGLTVYPAACGCRSTEPRPQPASFQEPTFERKPEPVDSPAPRPTRSADPRAGPSPPSIAGGPRPKRRDRHRQTLRSRRDPESQRRVSFYLLRRARHGQVLPRHTPTRVHRAHQQRRRGRWRSGTRALHRPLFPFVAAGALRVTGGEIGSRRGTARRGARG